MEFLNENILDCSLISTLYEFDGNLKEIYFLRIILYRKGGLNDVEWWIECVCPCQKRFKIPVIASITKFKLQAFPLSLNKFELRIPLILIHQFLFNRGCTGVQKNILPPSRRSSRKQGHTYTQRVDI